MPTYEGLFSWALLVQEMFAASLASYARPWSQCNMVSLSKSDLQVVTCSNVVAPV